MRVHISSFRKVTAQKQQQSFMAVTEDMKLSKEFTLRQSSGTYFRTFHYLIGSGDVKMIYLLFCHQLHTFVGADILDFSKFA